MRSRSIKMCLNIIVTRQYFNFYWNIKKLTEQKSNCINCQIVLGHSVYNIILVLGITRKYKSNIINVYVFSI